MEDRFRLAHGNSDGSHVGYSCGGRRRGGLLVEGCCHALSIGDGCDLGRGRGDRPRDDSFVGSRLLVRASPPAPGSPLGSAIPRRLTASPVMILT